MSRLFGRRSVEAPPRLEKTCMLQDLGAGAGRPMEDFIYDLSLPDEFGREIHELEIAEFPFPVKKPNRSWWDAEYVGDGDGLVVRCGRCHMVSIGHMLVTQLDRTTRPPEPFVRTELNMPTYCLDPQKDALIARIMEAYPGIVQTFFTDDYFQRAYFEGGARYIVNEPPYDDGGGFVGSFPVQG